MRPARLPRLRWGATTAWLLFALLLGAAVAFLAWLFVPVFW